MGEIPFSPIHFKVRTSLLKNTYTKIFFEIQDLFGLESEIETNKVLDFLNQSIQEECRREFTEKDFKRIKVAHLIHKEIQHWQELSELNQVFSLFDYRCFQYFLEFELPRHFALPMLFENASWKISGLEGIESVEPEKQVIICVTSDYQSLGFRRRTFT